MLLTVSIDKKSIGTKELFAGLTFTVGMNEKVAIIGRNGVGKTTLFGLLSGKDTDFEGTIQSQRGTRLVTTAQEHHDLGNQTVLDYILSQLPDYARLKDIIETYPETMGDDLKKIETYSNALEHFSHLGYYNIETSILLSLDAYQIDETMAHAPMRQLSGGQKRLVELVRVEHSAADAALIDEPTNHMDYIAKQAFIAWLKTTRHSVVVISHDRDVLQQVDRIIELKDGKAQVFKGNYDAYLKQNAVSTTTKMHDFEVTGRQIANLRQKIVQFRRLKEKARDPDTIKQFKRRELQAQTELAELEKIEKPTFWIDRDSASGLKKEVSERYEKYKAKNIAIRTIKLAGDNRELLKIEELTLSYDDRPLFTPLSVQLHSGQRLRLIGRNGAGKTTLVRAIVDAANNKRATTWRTGSIFIDRKTVLSIYEQEVNPALLELSLAEAIEQTYRDIGASITNEKVMQLLSDYLFDPYNDGTLKVHQLSGGQKARLQIIKMLANNPNLLMLDEPTNHLDLPSIEELENTLRQYSGAVLYVSHDSYFAHNLGGASIELHR